MPIKAVLHKRRGWKGKVLYSYIPGTVAGYCIVVVAAVCAYSVFPRKSQLTNAAGTLPGTHFEHLACVHELQECTTHNETAASVKTRESSKVSTWWA